jgi:hypothetical protein
MNRHIALLGDSIFDNRPYVSDGMAVIDHLWKMLSQRDQATLVAVDGDVTNDVLGQIARIPPEITHLALSVGGNDALGAIPLMSLPVSNVSEALGKLSPVRMAFHESYRRVIQSLASLGKPLAVCTVYEHVPGLAEELRTALSLFNDVITREAIAVNAHVIDLRSICTEPTDYSTRSPIEPSEQGGLKIANALASWFERTGANGN